MRKKSSPGVLSNCLLMKGLLIKYVPFSLQVYWSRYYYFFFFFGKHGCPELFEHLPMPPRDVFILPKKVLKAVGW